MKRTALVSISLLLLVICFSSATVLQNNGIAGFTGSPGEQTCFNCHATNALNTGGGTITIATTPSITANQYVPGTTYTVDVTIAKTAISLFGFGTEILNSSNANAGTISVLNSAQTKLLTSAGKTNIVHQLSGGASPDTKTFSFKWLAPATAGTAKIYAAGVAANGNNGSNGDFVYSTSLILSTPVGIEEKEVKMHLTVYPNPATDMINLAYTLAEEAQVQCELTSLNGTNVKTYFNIKQAAGEQNLVLDIPSSVAKGIYLLNLNVNTKKLSQRIIIN